jgi:HEAT repeats
MTPQCGRLVCLFALMLAGAQLEAQDGGPDQVRALLEGVRGATPIQCELAVHALYGWYSDHDVIPDRQPEAWSVVSWAQRGHREPSIVAPLAAALKDPDACVRRLSARLLGRSQLPAARARLSEALRDADPQLRRLGAIGLGFSNDKSVVPLLVRALADRDPQVRAAAAWAIGAVH